MNNVLTFVLMVFAASIPAYVLGYQIRKGLESLKISNYNYNVKRGFFFTNKRQLEKAIKESDCEDGK